MPVFCLPPSGNAVPPLFLLQRGKESFLETFSAHTGFNEDRILLTASGSSALFIVLKGLSSLQNVEGDSACLRVAVPAWCCPSVPQTVIQAGLQPVLIDLDPSTLGYDLAALHDARAQGLLAVVLVHFFGHQQFLPAGNWTGTTFIRDCAQDFDHPHDPDDLSPTFYSFGRGKALNSGHGGALCFPTPGPLLNACQGILQALPMNSEHVLPKALSINLLSHPHLFGVVSSLPFLGIGETVWKKPLKFQAISRHFNSLGSACLEAYLQRRQYYRQLVDRYRKLLLCCDGDWIYSPGAGVAQHTLPTRFPILTRDRELRDNLYQGINKAFGGVTRMYPKVLSEVAGAPESLSGGSTHTFPGARRIAESILTLPVTAELMGREDRFIGCITHILEKHGALRKRPSLFPST